ncbi:MAG: hypothetical protein IJL54_08415 [Prevotella sp.]|nr:hypothetical protein [Prevotella sp.]
MKEHRTAWKSNTQMILSFLELHLITFKQPIIQAFTLLLYALEGLISINGTPI